MALCPILNIPSCLRKAGGRGLLRVLIMIIKNILQRLPSHKPTGLRESLVPTLQKDSVVNL